MEAFRSILRRSLETGFIDKDFDSNLEYSPQLLTNNKTTREKVQNTILNELSDCEGFYFSVAFLTTGGISSLKGKLMELEEKQIPGKILVSQYLNFTQPEAIRMLRKFKNIDVKLAANDNFHAKGYLFKKNDHFSIIIGSSNLTQGALSKNKEWNLKVTADVNSKILQQTLNEFKIEFENADEITDDYLKRYEFIYNSNRERNKAFRNSILQPDKDIVPNKMQVLALDGIRKIRMSGKNKALLISATGTGKTFLSAFDVKETKPKKLLFVVHRKNIALKAMESFKSIIGDDVSYGIYSGSEKELEADYLFATIQTLSKLQHLEKFSKKHFDYIVVDETHRASANSYRNLLNYFSPKFLLGMTATPERSDSMDVFSLFDYNIAYEIRLHQALDEDMLVPFHYYGIADIEHNGELLDDNATVEVLTMEERARHIIEKALYFKTDSGIIRSLVFCSRQEECFYFASYFASKGFKTIALTSNNTEEERAKAIHQIESLDLDNKLDFIFTVDIFNEGVDIPSVNQIVMLRPTQSAIVFIQQLGRGLRKSENKSYLTVIDFIGNYNNNFMVPIALFGNNSYNRDNLRREMISSGNLLPGSSTVYFDRIVKEKILKSIDYSKFNEKKELDADFELLRRQLGRIPLMMDFVHFGSRDPYNYVAHSRSLYRYIKTKHNDFDLNNEELIVLDLMSSEINNGISCIETVILNFLLENQNLAFNNLNKILKAEFDLMNYKSIESIIANINFNFVKQNYNVVDFDGVNLRFHNDFTKLLSNKIFLSCFKDNVLYGKHSFKEVYSDKKMSLGFVLHEKYSRKDVCRILGWEKNIDSTMYGYIVKNGYAPIFVNYHKNDDISTATRYEDKFISSTRFQWMTRHGKRIDMKTESQIINSSENGTKILLFVQKKSINKENQFYFMGEVKVIKDSVVQMETENEKNQKLPIVKMEFNLLSPVTPELYEYILF